VERRQAETLMEEGETRDARDADRRSQQALDDWFRNRRPRADAEARSDPPVHSAMGIGEIGSERDSPANDGT